jgi:hypothetical protein
LGGYGMHKKLLDSTIKINRDTREILANLDFAKKRDTYDDIILKLIEEYENFKKNRSAK